MAFARPQNINMNTVLKLTSPSPKVLEKGEFQTGKITGTEYSVKEVETKKDKKKLQLVSLQVSLEGFPPFMALVRNIDETDKKSTNDSVDIRIFKNEQGYINAEI